MAPQREWFEKDYYKVLGVADNATDKEISRAYRKLAKELHPDRNPGAEDRFKDVTAAYEVLGDPEKRKEYDEVRKLGPMAGTFGGPGGFGQGGFGQGGFGGPGGGTFRVDDLGNLGDLFGGIFTGGRGAAGRRPRGGQRGADLETELHLSFKDAIHGVTTSVSVPQEVQCHTCGGSGAKPGTSPHVCEHCGGRGVLDDNQGLFSLATICPVCNGRGTVVDDPCPTCHGTGTERRLRQIRVRIPPGVEDGQRIRVKGRGGPGQGMGAAGDLYVVVRVGKHKVFGRRGRDLTVNVPVTFSEATLGTTVTVPTLDGPVTVRVPSGTSSGKTLRVRGRGVPAGGKKNGKPGDLLVKIEVAVPTNLSDEQRAAVENLAAVSDAAPREHLEV